MSKVALVAGGSSGIGLATATALGGRGWSVGIGARDTDRLERAASACGAGAAHQLDVADAASVDTWFAHCEATLGPIDAVVVNAGIAELGALRDVEPETIQRVIDVDLTGAALVAQRAVTAFGDRRGDLCFISSDATQHPRPQLATYAAAKAGVEMLATTLALELEGTGVRVSLVRVGPTAGTGFADRWEPSALPDLLGDWERFGHGRHRGVLTPGEVAAVIASHLELPAGVHVTELTVVPEAPKLD